MTDPAPETPARLAEEGERLYRLLATHSADVFAVFDLEGRAIYVSPSVYKLRGYTPEECLLQGPAQRLTPHSQEVVNRAFAEVMAVEQAGQTPPTPSGASSSSSRARTARRSGWNRPSRGCGTRTGGPPASSA